MTPPTGPAMSGAMVTVTDANGVQTTYVRHGGEWLELLIPRPDFDALLDEVEQVSAWDR